jgi:hypothetical protein
MAADVIKLNNFINPIVLGNHYLTFLPNLSKL